MAGSGAGDRMRISGPELSIAPPERKAAGQLLQGGKRRDGRRPEAGMPQFMKTNVVSQARGSAYVEMGSTKVMAACYGPRDTLRTREYNARGKLECEFKFAPFACAKRRGLMQDDEEKDLSGLVRQALAPAVLLEKYPKALIDVYITVLESDGCALAAAVTCASLALANGGIEMRDLVCGSSQALCQDTLLMDPTSAEEAAATATMTLAYMPATDEVSAMVQQGELPFGKQAQCLQDCVKGALGVHQLQLQCLRSAALKHTAKSL